MNRKLKYTIIFSIFISISLLIISRYLDIIHDKNLFDEYSKTLRNEITRDYKHHLKDVSENTISYLRVTNNMLVKNYEYILENEIKSINEKLKNRTLKYKNKYLKTYSHDFISVDSKRNDNSIHKTILIDNKLIFLSISFEFIDSLLIKEVNNYLNSTLDKIDVKVIKILNFNGGDKYAKIVNESSLANRYMSTNEKDAKGNLYYLQELENIKEKGYLFNEYYTKDSETNNISKKLSYSSLFIEKNWIITSEILFDKIDDDVNNKTNKINKEFNTHLYEMLIFEIFIIILFITIFLTMKNRINIYFKKYKSLQEKLEIKFNEMESNYKDLFYKNKSIILITDPLNGDILDANESAINFYNYHNLEDIKKVNINDINVLSAQEIKKEIAFANAQNKKFYLSKHKTSSGEVIPVKIFSTPTKYNNTFALHLIIHNANDEYRVKKDLFKTIDELKKVKLNLDMAQKIFHMGSWEYDVKTKELFSSKELSNIFEIENSNIKDIKELLLSKVHPHDRLLVINSFEKYINEKIKCKLKFRLLFDDGNVKYLEEQSEPIFDKNNEHIKTVGTIHDITELTVMENQMHKFFNHSINLLVVSSFDGVMIQVNPGWKKILGYDEGDLINTSFLTLVHKNDIEDTINEMKKLENGEVVYYFENRYRHKDGSYKTIAWTANGFADNNTIYATGQDITEMKEKTSMLFQQSKMASMGEMIGNIAHQWRQPLSVISIAASGIKLQHEMKVLDDKNLIELLNGIVDSTNYLSKTIEDFRDFFNPNKEELKCNSVELFNKVIKMITPQLKYSNIELIEEIEDVEFLTYPNELLQVIINILNNAKDQLENLNEENRFIFINVFKYEHKIIIKIKDNGKGIDKSIINKIFEPYFTTKNKSIGTGIGLYMSKEIITKHMNGELIVRNDDFIYKNTSYKGAEFSIVLDLEGLGNE